MEDAARPTGTVSQTACLNPVRNHHARPAAMSDNRDQQISANIAASAAKESAMFKMLEALCS